MALGHTKQCVVALPWRPIWLPPHVGEKPFLYLVLESLYVVAANRVVVHKEIGVRFVFRHQMAYPIGFIFGLCPHVGGRRKPERVLLIRSRVKGIVAFKTSQRRCRGQRSCPTCRSKSTNHRCERDMINSQPERTRDVSLQHDQV